MEIRHIRGRTWIFQNAVTIPFYRLNEWEVVLLDSGFSTKDQRPLDNFLKDNHLRVAAILGSHAHQDHAGNLAYFQQRHGAKIILPEIEAALLSSPHMIRMLYPTATLAEARDTFAHLLIRSDRTFSPQERSVSFGGETFGLLPLPGHTPGHTGIVTPDDILYVGDTIVSQETLDHIRIPSVFCWEEDLASKELLLTASHSGFLLAHSGYYDDITVLTEKNLCYQREFAAGILALLHTPMPLCQFEKVVWQNRNINCRTMLGIAKFRRNLRCAVEYLVSCGAVSVTFQDGVTLYRQA